MIVIVCIILLRMISSMVLMLYLVTK